MDDAASASNVWEWEMCDFCDINIADYGFDWEWDAQLCWLCHLYQNYLMFMAKYSVRKEKLWETH